MYEFFHIFHIEYRWKWPKSISFCLGLGWTEFTTPADLTQDNEATFSSLYCIYFPLITLSVFPTCSSSMFLSSSASHLQLSSDWSVNLDFLLKCASTFDKIFTDLFEMLWSVSLCFILQSTFSSEPRRISCLQGFWLYDK